MKQKTHQGTKKRVKITKTGKMLKGKVRNSHLYRKQRVSKKHRKSRTDSIKNGFVTKIKKLINI